MRYRRALDRIHEAVGSDYHTPTAHLAPRQAGALDEVAAGLRRGDDPARLRARVQALHDEGVLDRAGLYSALGVLAASPAVRDYAEAMRLAGLQELAAWEAGGQELSVRLASVERHRGVVAFLLGRYEVALESFTRALERERSAENLANVLATLVRLGDLDEAREILSAVRAGFPDAIRVQLDDAIARDRDLAALRS